MTIYRSKHNITQQWVILLLNQTPTISSMPDINYTGFFYSSPSPSFRLAISRYPYEVTTNPLPYSIKLYLTSTLMVFLFFACITFSNEADSNPTSTNLMKNMFSTTQTAEDHSKLITEPGNYPVRITSVSLVTPEKSEAVFHDGIQQAKLTGTTADGKIISMFLNAVAFAQLEDLTEKQKQSGKFTTKEYEGTSYVVDKVTGKRLVLPDDHKKSIATQQIYKSHGFNCGLTDFTLEDFANCSVVFVVREETRGSNTRVKVIATRKASEEVVLA